MRMTRRTIVQGSLLGAAGMLGLHPVRADEAAVAPTSDERQRMAQLAADFMDTYRVPGLSVAIAKSGQPVYVEAFGLADQEAKEKLTPQHRFRIASISKPITSSGIFLLIEAGKFSLTSHVFGPNSILGDDYPTPPGQETIEQITIEHLLTHTAGGWSNNASDPMFANPQMSQRELIAWTLQTDTLDHPPGTAYAYSNFGYCILGRVIEKTTGQKYDDFIKGNVLNRCGITGMQIGGNTLNDRASDEVKYYDGIVPDPRSPYRMNIARMDSHGGWIATPSDLMNFFNHIDGFDDTKQLLSADTLKVMTTPSAVEPHYAKGLEVNKANNWWHGGSLPGTATIAVRAHTHLCWAGFTNTRSDFADMSLALDQLMWHMALSVPAWRATSAQAL